MQIFAIEHSQRLNGLILSTHLLAAAGCWLNSLALSNRLILLVFLLSSLFIQLWRYNKKQIVSLKYSEHGGWELVLINDLCIPVEFEATSVLTVWMMLLSCKIGRQKKIIVVFSDALSDKDYRTMLATLKTSG
nr:protein YgfX [Methylomarinum sp. Ch1-1]MDP4520503.1 hypothetical protein [Methylomarinum sp. Ch1-1]